MNRVALTFLSALMAGCSSVAVPAPHKTSNSHISTHASVVTAPVKERTPEQEKKKSITQIAYFSALCSTIRDIDDGSTSAEIIAKVAVSKNLELLKEKDRAATIHIEESSWLAAQTVREMLDKLPSQNDIELATYLVLKIRQEPARKATAANP